MTLTKPISPWLSVTNFRAKELSKEEIELKIIKDNEFKARELDRSILEGKHVIHVPTTEHKTPIFEEFDFSHSEKFMHKSKSWLTTEDL